ncbi:MAG: YjbQ family protein [Acidothermaceae bacterium]
MRSSELRVETGSTLVSEITEQVTDFCSGQGDGLINVFVPHATAGVALIETGSGTERDLAATIDRVWPAEVRYVHAHGSPKHGRDHVLPAFVSPSITVPVIGGRPALGTWQSIVVVDTNVDNRVRTVRLSFVSG